MDSARCPAQGGPVNAPTRRCDPVAMVDGIAAPSGSVTFLFTDVEGSTRLWAEDPDAMSASLRVHDQIMRSSIEERGGYVFTTAGDAFCAAKSPVTDTSPITTMQPRPSGPRW